jgi:hypothetical protein
MPHTIEEIERAQQHVLDGIARIAAQRRRITALKIAGFPTEEAEILLRMMRRNLRQTREDLRRMIEKREQ